MCAQYYHSGLPAVQTDFHRSKLESTGDHIAPFHDVECKTRMGPSEAASSYINVSRVNTVKLLQN